jgi:hypothetical protein
MAHFKLHVRAANYGEATVISCGKDGSHVGIEIHAETVWDADGLRKLAATLQGAAGIIEACSTVEA